jgi:hypothetical protein
MVHSKRADHVGPSNEPLPEQPWGWEGGVLTGEEEVEAALAFAQARRSAQWTETLKSCLVHDSRQYANPVLDFERGRSNSKFDTAAASTSKWTSKSIERRLGAECHIVLQYKTKLLVSSKNIERNE